MQPIKHTITNHGITLSPEIDAHIEKFISGLQKYLEHGDQSASVHIVLRFEKRHTSTGTYIAEIDFHARHIDVSAHGEKESLISALDDARDEIASALGNRKQKKIHFMRKSARRLKTLFKGFSQGKQ